MLLIMRRSMVITLCAFIFFGIAYLFLMHVVDPRPPFEAIASMHADISIAFSFVNASAYSACLAVVLGGLPVLIIAFRHALAEKHGRLLAVFALRPKHVLLLVLLAVGIEVVFFVFLFVLQIISAGLPSLPSPTLPLSPLELMLQLSLLALFTFVLLTGTVLVSRIILHSAFSTRVLRYALIPMAITTLAMGIAFVATSVWIVRLWVDVPQFADSQGLGPAGLRGNVGGSEGVIIIVVMMILATTAASIALARGLRARKLPVAYI